MSETINIHQKEKRRYIDVRNRIAELEELLGFARDESGGSLSRRSMKNDFAKRRMDQLQEKYPAEFEELLSLDAESARLEEKLGLDEKYKEFLDSLDDEDDPTVPDIW